MAYSRQPWKPDVIGAKLSVHTFISTISYDLTAVISLLV